MKGFNQAVCMALAVLIAVFVLTACNDDVNVNSVETQASTETRPYAEAVFTPADDMDVTDVQLDAAKAIIETRVDLYEIADGEVSSDYENDRITVRFPLQENDADFDPEAIVDELAATAELTFRNPDGEIVMDGSDVERATPGVNQESDEYVVDLEFTATGARQFAAITEQYLNQQIAICLDDEMLSNPTITAVITEGRAQIGGEFDADSATKLANQINAGALPFVLEVTSYSVQP